MGMDEKPIHVRYLGACEVCSIHDAKYTCPRCEVKTCSLACVNIHKKELDCNGVRDKVKFKPVKKMGNIDLQNDYRLLEEMSRNITVLHRNPLNRVIRKHSLPAHMFKLKNNALKRGVTLQFLPQCFTRHQINTTYLNWKTEELFWRIEFVFPQADNFTVSDEKVLDSLRLSAVVDNHLSCEDSKELLFYQSAGLTGTTPLLKAECVSGGNRFYELDYTLSVRENLEGKLIIEFPVIFVILKEHKFMYDIIDPDMEEKIAEENKNSWRHRKHVNIEEEKDNETIEKTKELPSNDIENMAVSTDLETRRFPNISYEFDY